MTSRNTKKTRAAASWSEALARALAGKAKQGAGTKLDEIARAVVAQACAGDARAAKEIIDRCEGHQRDDGEPPVVEIIHTFETQI